MAPPFARIRLHWPRTRRWGLLLALFLILANWSVWPAPRLPFTVVPTSSGTSATVPMLNVWTVWWNADRLACGLRNYWDAPIFYPEPGTFAFSDPQPATGLVAPIVWISGSPVLAYLSYLIGSLVLNAVFAVRLLRTFHATWWAATVGGLATLFHPLVHQRIEVSQLIPLWATLWTFDAIVRLRRRPSVRIGVELGIATAAVFMTSVHHGVFLAFLLAPTAWLTMPLNKWRRWTFGVAVAFVAAVLLLAPLLWPMHQFLKQQGFSRQRETVESLSATRREWSHVPPQSLLGGSELPPHVNRTLSPGWLRAAVVLFGLPFLLRRSRYRAPILFLAVLGCWSFFWSFGGNLNMGTWHPWLTLTQWVPGFAQVRSVFRFAYFTQLVLILLAALSIDRIGKYCQLVRGGKRQLSLRAALLILGALIAVEVPPAPVRLVGVPDVTMPQPWTTYLRTHVSPGQSVVCLPFAMGDTVESFDQTTRWMLYGIQHRAPLLNGYSGYFPLSWHRLSRALHRAPFSEATLEMLDAAKVEFIVLDRRRIPRGDSVPSQSGGFSLTKVFSDPSDIEIWRLAWRDDNLAL